MNFVRFTQKWMNFYFLFESVDNFEVIKICHPPFEQVKTQNSVCPVYFFYQEHVLAGKQNVFPRGVGKRQVNLK